MLEPAELAAIASRCERSGVQLISDEIYHGISYAGAPATSSAWTTSREAVVVNSFSKYFSMTGWRLGWLLVPRRLRHAVVRLTGNFTVCPPALAQHAAVAAFDPAGYAEADAHVARYAANRALLLDGLPTLGVDPLAAADGAFYVYAEVSHLTDDSMDCTYRLLAETGVAVAPGVDFDPVDGHRFVRLSCAGRRRPRRAGRRGAGCGGLRRWRSGRRRSAPGWAHRSAGRRLGEPRRGPAPRLDGAWPFHRPDPVQRRGDVGVADVRVRHQADLPRHRHRPHSRVLEAVQRALQVGDGDEHDVGLGARADQPRSRRPVASVRAFVVVGQPLDAVQPHQRRRGEHAALADATAEHLAQPPRVLDELGGARPRRSRPGRRAPC